jgi:hypothetical protein
MMLRGRRIKCSPRFRPLASLIAPALLWAFVINVLQAYPYDVTPILCEDVADDADTPLDCYVLEDCTKDTQSDARRAPARGKEVATTTLRPRLAPARAGPPTRLGSVRLPLKRPPSQRAGSSADSIEPH